MKMNCPHCGLGGTVADELYLEIVRCPECRKLCRVTIDVLLDLLGQSVAETMEPGLEEPSMRLKCPHCSRGGTTAEACYRKVVTCPDCKGVFRVTGNVLIDRVAPVVGDTVEPGLDDQTVLVKEKYPVTEAMAVDPEPVIEDTGLQECSGCGFTFSSNFISVIDGQQICPVCAN